MCSWPFSSPHIITDPPVLSVLQSSVKVKEGDRLDLQCTFTKHMNDPNSFPTITWNNSSGRRVSQTTQGLTLISTYKRRSSRSEDRGVYTCSVNICPAVGELTDTVTVTVYCELCVCFALPLLCVHVCVAVYHLRGCFPWLSYFTTIQHLIWS